MQDFKDTPEHKDILDIAVYTGYCCSNGFQGYTGAQGYTGYQGYTGFQGFTGHQGFTGRGYQGYTGFQGYTGYQGYQGKSGSFGGATFEYIADLSTTNSTTQVQLKLFLITQQ